MKKLYDLAVKTREYTDNQGQKKGVWQNVGVVMQDDKGGKFITLARWFSPAGVPDLSGKGGDSIILSMFEPKEQGQQNAPQQSQHQQQKTNGYAPQSRIDEEDIPF